MKVWHPSEDKCAHADTHQVVGEGPDCKPSSGSLEEDPELNWRRGVGAEREHQGLPGGVNFEPGPEARMLGFRALAAYSTKVPILINLQSG